MALPSLTHLSSISWLISLVEALQGTSVEGKEGEVGLPFYRFLVAVMLLLAHEPLGKTLALHFKSFACLISVGPGRLMQSPHHIK